jgi:type II secretory pathway component PulJ
LNGRWEGSYGPLIPASPVQRIRWLMKKSSLEERVCHAREGGYPNYSKKIDSRLHGNDDERHSASFQYPDGPAEDTE